MTATYIMDRLEGVPCGNCGATLPALDVVRGLLFESLSDLPDSVRSTEINHVTCNACGFGGWLWVGFICADVVRKRAIFVFSRLDSIPYTDSTLSNTVERCSAEIPEWSHLVGEDNFLFIDHYDQLLPTLLMEDEKFERLKAVEARYYRRRRIGAVAARANQLVDDALELGLFARFDDESSVDFLRGCINELDTRQSKVDESLHGPLEWLRGRLTAILDEKLREPAPSTPHSVSPSSDAIVPFDRQLSGLLWGPLLQFVESEARAFGIRASGDSAGGSVVISTLADRLNQAILRATPLEGESVIDRATRAQKLSDSVARVQDLVPSGFVSTERRNGMLLTDEMVELAAMGDRDLQKALADIVACRQEGRDATLNEATIKLFADLATTFGDIEATVLAYCVAAAHFGCRGDHAAQSSALCCAILASYVRARNLSMDGLVMDFIADGWRTLASQLLHRGAFDMGSLCLGEAAKGFAWLGRVEPELDCRIEALEMAPRLDAATEIAAPARTLLARLGQLDPAKSWKNKCRLGVLIGDELLDHARAMPLVVSDVVDPDGTTSSSMRAYNPRPDVPPQGQISAYCEDVNGASTVYALKVSDVPWLEQYEGVIQEAYQHGGSEGAAFFMLRLASKALSLRIPEIARYQLSRLEDQIETNGLGENALPVALTIAQTIARDLRQSGYATENNDRLRRAVERCESLISEGGRRSTIGGVPIIANAEALQLGELLECLGCLDAAIRWHLEGSKRAEDAVRVAWNVNHRQQIEANIVRGYWRAARAAAKLAVSTSSPTMRATAVHWAEAARQYAVRLRMRSDPTEMVEGISKGESVLMASTSATMHYSLIQETSLHDGFWMIALQAPDGSIVDLALKDLEEVHAALKSVGDLFHLSRKAAASAMLDDLLEIERERLPSYERALATLGNLLFPPALARYLPTFERITIVPEAYLWDVPWAALRVEAHGDRQCYLHAVQGSRGPLLFCVAPNLRVAQQEAIRASNEVPGISVMHASVIPWRKDLAPTFGLRRHIEQSIERTAGHLGNVLTVVGDVQGFRTLLESVRLAIFSGHAEATEGGDLALLVHDGQLGAAEIHALRAHGSAPIADAVILCACAGVRSFYEAGLSRRELGGVHVQLIREGVRFVLGSTQPLSVVAAAAMIDVFLPAIAMGVNLDDATCLVVRKMAQDSRLFSPLFWGGIIGFGKGDFALAQQEVS